MDIIKRKKICLYIFLPCKKYKVQCALTYTAVILVFFVHTKEKRIRSDFKKKCLKVVLVGFYETMKKISAIF